MDLKGGLTTVIILPPWRHSRDKGDIIYASFDSLAKGARFFTAQRRAVKKYHPAVVLPLSSDRRERAVKKRHLGCLKPPARLPGLTTWTKAGHYFAPWRPSQGATSGYAKGAEVFSRHNSRAVKKYRPAVVLPLSSEARGSGSNGR